MIRTFIRRPGTPFLLTCLLSVLASCATPVSRGPSEVAGAPLVERGRSVERASLRPGEHGWIVAGALRGEWSETRAVVHVEGLDPEGSVVFASDIQARRVPGTQRHKHPARMVFSSPVELPAAVTTVRVGR